MVRAGSLKPSIVLAVVMGAWWPAYAQQPSEAAPEQGSQSKPPVVRTDYDNPKPAAPPKLSEAELAGRRLFTQRCGLCHDPGGQARAMGPWLDRETLTRLGDGGVRQIVATGSRNMPGFRFSLEPAQIDQLLAFLKTVSPQSRPKPPAPRS